MREIVDRGQRLWLLYLLVGILATGTYFLLPSATAQNVFIVLIDSSVLAAIVAGVLLHQPSHPLPWYLFAFGSTLVVAGDAFWAIYSLETEYLYPSVADVFYVGSVPLFVAGLLLIGRGGIGRKGANLIDSLILATSTGIFSWSFIVDSGMQGSPSSLLERLLSVTYLFVYVVLLAIVIRPLFVPEKRSPALYLLCCSLVSLVVGDLAYGSITSSTYEVYAAGGLFYAWLLLSTTFLGAATLHPSMAALSEPVSEAPVKLTWWRLVLLSGAMLLAPAMLALQTALGEPIDVLLTAGSSVVLFSLVALRMSGMITERKLLEQRLKFQAFHDPLTRLPNRTLFMERFEQALARSERQGGKVAVMFVDLDDFKEVNDSLGHETGDRVLVAVAKRLRVCLRPSDTAARLGGDEFTVLLEDVEDAQGAVRVAERILEELRTPIILGELERIVRASIGIALGSGTYDRPGDLLRRADLALYRAKGRGKADYEVFEPGLEDKINL
jgi:diguanylate cyclase